MKILVCVKGVPELFPPLTAATDIPWADLGNVSEYRMNRYDEYALEEAIRIKEAVPNVEIDAVSMGGPQVRTVLRRAMAMGAGNGFHIMDERRGFIDAADTAARIAAAAASQHYTLILTGVMAEDDMQSLVGPALAACLDMPCATAVTALTVSADKNAIQVTSELEGGLSEIIDIQLPALLTVQSGINQPRYPSLSNMLRARSQALVEIGATEAAAAPQIDARTIALPAQSDRCEFLDGQPEEKARALLGILKKKALLKKDMD